MHYLYWSSLSLISFAIIIYKINEEEYVLGISSRIIIFFALVVVSKVIANIFEPNIGSFLKYKISAKTIKPSSKFDIESIENHDSSEIDYGNFKDMYCWYHISLMTMISYYGDNKISKEELKYLNIMTTKFMDDVKNKDIVAKEELLKMLDIVKKTLPATGNSHIKFEEVRGFVRFVAYQLKIHVDCNSGGDKQVYINTMNSLMEYYYNGIKINKHKTKTDILLLKEIQDVFSYC